MQLEKWQKKLDIIINYVSEYEGIRVKERFNHALGKYGFRAHEQGLESPHDHVEEILEQIESF